MDDFPLCPQQGPPPSNCKFYFYCRLAISANHPRMSGIFGTTRASIFAEWKHPNFTPKLGETNSWERSTLSGHKNRGQKNRPRKKNKFLGTEVPRNFSDQCSLDFAYFLCLFSGRWSKSFQELCSWELFFLILGGFSPCERIAQIQIQIVWFETSLREAKLGGLQTRGFPTFFGKGPDCVADPFGTGPQVQIGKPPRLNPPPRLVALDI